MIPSRYVETIEHKLAWLRSGEAARQSIEMQYGKITDTYIDILQSSDTFYMDRHFGDLVDHARRAIDSRMTFDAKWLLAKRGWLYLEQPFEVPAIMLQDANEKLYIRAVGWREVPPGGILVAYDGTQTPAPPGTVQFCFYHDHLHWINGEMDAGLRPGQWRPWSFFALKEGWELGERMLDFEERGRRENPNGSYVDSTERSDHPLHEMRWLFAALYLMNQRLATTIPQPADRATRRRAEKAGQTAPPLIRVITLRRMEQERARAQAAGENMVHWQWKWSVRGHWRRKPNTAEDAVKDVYIESYVKAPNPDAPMKPDTLKLFVAKR